MKQCPNCGAELPDEARFCIHCMTVLTEKTFLKPIKIIGRWQRNSAIALLVCISFTAAIFSAVFLYKTYASGDESAPIPSVSNSDFTENKSSTTNSKYENSGDTTDIDIPTDSYTDYDTESDDFYSDPNMGTDDFYTESDITSDNFYTETDSDINYPDFNWGNTSTTSTNSNTTTDKTTTKPTNTSTSTTTNSQTSTGTTDTGTESDNNIVIPNFNNGFIVAVNRKTRVPSGYIGIYTKQDLNNIRKNPAEKYILMNDIEFTDADFAEDGTFYNNGAGWEPIAFGGHFDGNGYKIKNLYLNINSYENTSVGLFKTCSGTVENLGLVDSKFSETMIHHNFSYLGSIAGACTGTIRNCYHTGEVTISTTSMEGTAMDPTAGGIVGKLEETGSIQNCYNAGEITGTSANLEPSVGGIVGLLEDGTTVINCKNYGKIAGVWSGGIVGDASGGKITNCYNLGTISGEISGGIVGYSSGTKTNTTIENCGNEGSITARKAGGITGSNYSYSYLKIIGCYNTGTVTSSQYAGGIIGVINNSDSIVRNCYNNGKIVKKPTIGGAFGGIVGDSSGIVEYCYNAGEISPAKTSSFGLSGGIVGYDTGNVSKCYYIDTSEKGIGQGPRTSTKCTSAQMKQQSTFTDFDFDTVWTMGSGSYPYPILRDVPMAQ